MTIMTSIHNVVSLSKEIVEILRKHGHSGPAADLDNLIGELLSADELRQRAILQDICERCDVRWLGDLYLSGVSLNDWWNSLEKLKNIAKRALKTK